MNHDLDLDYYKLIQASSTYDPSVNSKTLEMRLENKHKRMNVYRKHTSYDNIFESCVI